MGAKAEGDVVELALALKILAEYPADAEAFAVPFMVELYQTISLDIRHCK